MQGTLSMSVTGMRALGVGAGLVGLVLPIGAHGQAMTNVGTPSARAAARLQIAAASPTIRSNTKFRMTFKVLSANGGDQYVSTHARNSELDGWSAITSGGALCKVHFRQLSGAPVGVNYRLHQNDDIAIASTTRAVFMSAEFNCDANVASGDEVTVQARMYMAGSRDEKNWVQADYVFDRVKVSK